MASYKTTKKSREIQGNSQFLQGMHAKRRATGCKGSAFQKQ
jgi:hypothetical protein